MLHFTIARHLILPLYGKVTPLVIILETVQAGPWTGGRRSNDSEQGCTIQRESRVAQYSGWERVSISVAQLRVARIGSTQDRLLNVSP